LDDPKESLEQSFEMKQENSENATYIAPRYYLRNFFIVLDSVMQDHSHLFIDEELKLIYTFKELNESEQRVFVRLFQRKGPWFRMSNLEKQYELEIPDIKLHCLSLQQS